MFKSIYNQYGSVSYDISIINKIVSDTMKDFADKAALGDSSIRRTRKTADDSQFIEAYWEDECLVISLKIIVAFGSSINGITNGILTELKTNLEKTLGVSDTSLKIVVTGVKTSHTVAKRNIEVTL